jgi:hypothetical protein
MWLSIGNFLFVRLCHRVAEGDELTVSYVPTTDHFWDRKRKLANWIGSKDGFTCDCERCAAIAAVGETADQRRARADDEMYVCDAYKKITSECLTNRDTPKNTIVDKNIPRTKFDALKRVAEALPMKNRETLSLLLELQIGLCCDRGDVVGALRAARQLVEILGVTGTLFSVIKYTLITVGLAFVVGEGSSSSVAECRASLLATRALCYPEISKDETGDDAFAMLCDCYCFLGSQCREKNLRALISECAAAK